MASLVSLADHTIDVARLPVRPIVLDVGCLGWTFGKALRELTKPNFPWIIGMDPSTNMAWEFAEDSETETFLRAALVGTGNSEQKFYHLKDGERSCLFSSPNCSIAYGDDVKDIYHVDCYTIDEVRLMYGIEKFDVVKLDCEGSEFEILERWPGPIATQISVEFHDLINPKYRSITYYDQLWKKLPWYEVVQHPFTSYLGHHDTLLVLRQ